MLERYPPNVLVGMLEPLGAEIQQHVNAEWSAVGVAPRNDSRVSDWASKAARGVASLFGSLKRGAVAALTAGKLSGEPHRPETAPTEPAREPQPAPFAEVVRSWGTAGLPTRHGSLESRFAGDVGQLVHTASQDMHRARAAAVGASWTWRTQRDNRVRKKHQALEGKKFAPGEVDPSEGRPGDPYGCRCWAAYVLPGRDRLARVTLQPRYDRGLAKLDFTEGAALAPGVSPATTDPITGFVRATAYLARDGLLVYGDQKDHWNEIRPREELVRAADSFADAAITDLHPEGMVTTENADDVARGHVIGAPYVTEPDAHGVSYLAADLLYTSKDLLAKIKDGMRELSIGFWARIVDAPDGTDAKFAQVDMQGNHVANVPQGRAGPSCKVFLDHSAWCAYDLKDVGTQDAQATELVDYPMPDGTIYQIPTPVAAQLAAYQGTIAELTAENQSMSDPEKQPEPPAVEPPAAEKPEEKGDVSLPREVAIKLIVDAMPWLEGKIDDASDVQSLLSAALAKPKADAAPPAPAPFAEPAKVAAGAKKDTTNAPVGAYLAGLGI